MAITGEKFPIALLNFFMNNKRMKQGVIIKTGSTYDEIESRFGDFPAMIIDSSGYMGSPLIINAENEAPLPPPENCLWVIITGSHSMVTDNHLWSLKLVKWIKNLIDNEIPLLGICFGHQIIAKAAGGIVGYNPNGEELGTVMIKRVDINDPLFNNLPMEFQAQVIHSQSVLQLPPDALLLAGNSHEGCHGFRIGKSAWGVQFHPEFSEAVMKKYLEYRNDRITQIKPAKESSLLIKKFIALWENG